MDLTLANILIEKSDCGDNILIASRMNTPLGEMLSLEAKGGICLLEFSGREGLDKVVQTLLKKTKSKLSWEGNAFLHALQEELNAYFLDSSHQFTVPLSLFGTEFEISVWNALQAIPVGQTLSYSQLAENLGRPKAVRAIGHANAKNPIAIIVPCHRLIGASGDLTGYGGGIWRKKWLLQHEQSAPLE